MPRPATSSLGIEIHGEITKSGKASLPVLERIGRKNVLINYDTANVDFYGAVKAVDDLPVSIPKLVHVHLKDKLGEGKVWDFPAIGEGDIDFARVLQILDKGGYTGPVERRDRVHRRAVAAARRGQPGDEGVATTSSPRSACRERRLRR